MVRSPLGLPLGDRGLLPLPDALPGVGAGVVAGGPYTVPQRMLDTLTGASSRTGALGGILNPIFVYPLLLFMCVKNQSARHSATSRVS